MHILDILHILFNNIYMYHQRKLYIHNLDLCYESLYYNIPLQQRASFHNGYSYTLRVRFLQHPRVPM